MNKIVEMRFGSHLYGTQTPESDVDIKGIYLPTAREIVLGNYKRTVSTQRSKAPGERNNKDDVDTEFFSLDRFLELLAEGQTVALDMVFGIGVDDVRTDFGAAVMSDVFMNLDKLLTRNINAFVGYARRQAARYGIKGSRMDAVRRVVEFLDARDPKERLCNHVDALHALVAANRDLVSLEKTALISIENLPGPMDGLVMPHLQTCGRKVPFHATIKTAREVFGRILDQYGERSRKANLAGGIDWKALSHAVRVNSEAKELLTTGKITFPRPDAELLLGIKKGEMRYEDVAEMIESGVAELEECSQKSGLREAADQKWIDDFVCLVYSKIVRGAK